MASMLMRQAAYTAPRSCAPEFVTARTNPATVEFIDAADVDPTPNLWLGGPRTELHSGTCVNKRITPGCLPGGLT